MNASTLSFRARNAGLYAAVGLTTLVGPLAIAGPIHAADELRFTVTAKAVCGADGTVQDVELFYDDHVDGHVPQSVTEKVGKSSSEGGITEWSGGGTYQENGDYFNRRSLKDLGVTVDPSGLYDYWVTITYDDSITQTAVAMVNLPSECPVSAPPPPVSPPSIPASSRFTIKRSTDDCYVSSTAPSITFSYDDHADGHVPVAVHETLEEGTQTLWTADEVHQVGGDYFNERTFPMGGRMLTFGELYNYSVSITYDDGVIQSGNVIINDLCYDSENIITTPASTVRPASQAPTPAATLPATR